MSPTDSPRRRPAALLLAALCALPGACAPQVSKLEMISAQSKVDAANAQRQLREREFNDLNAEHKSLIEFKGPEHDRAMQRVVELVKEKAVLEDLKKDLDARLAKFAEDTKKCQESLAKDKAGR